MPSRREYSRDAAMAKKRDTDEFERMHRSEVQAWDDEVDESSSSTYWQADERGPEPVPDWVITDDAAGQRDLGMLKTGKEADVHLVEREIGGTVNVLAAKRYRKFEDRMFRNDARYRAARRTGESHVDKAMATGNRIGMAFRARHWLATEFESLCRLWAAGVPVPYPVQRFGSEVMLELIGSSEQAAPRLVNARPSGAEARALWERLLDALHRMVGAGVVHGDLSPYNILVDGERLVIIDFPQAVDPLAHPEGLSLLQRDVGNVCGWFVKRGVRIDTDEVFAQLLDSAFRHPG